MTLLNLLGGGAAQSCTVAAPIPSLPPQLASLGGFDQAYDANDTQTLDSLATEAAAAISQNLIGATPGAPVREAAVQETPQRAVPARQPEAIVIPLLYPSSSSHAGRVAGLVGFLVDCAGRAYFASVQDLTSLSTAPAVFPAVSAQTAATELGTTQPQLVYTSTPVAGTATAGPFVPYWLDPANGALLPATG